VSVGRQADAVEVVQVLNGSELARKGVSEVPESCRTPSSVEGPPRTVAASSSRSAEKAKSAHA